MEDLIPDAALGVAMRHQGVRLVSFHHSRVAAQVLRPHSWHQGRVRDQHRQQGAHGRLDTQHEGPLHVHGGGHQHQAALRPPALVSQHDIGGNQPAQAAAHHEGWGRCTSVAAVQDVGRKGDSVVSQLREVLHVVPPPLRVGGAPPVADRVKGVDGIAGGGKALEHVLVAPHVVPVAVVEDHNTGGRPGRLPVLCVVSARCERVSRRGRGEGVVASKVVVPRGRDRTWA
jgi:hypothetical protein